MPRANAGKDPPADQDKQCRPDHPERGRPPGLDRSPQGENDAIGLGQEGGGARLCIGKAIHLQRDPDAPEARQQ